MTDSERLMRIEKICTEILVKVNRLEIMPLREALNDCRTPDEVKTVLNAYIEATKAAM